MKSEPESQNGHNETACMHGIQPPLFSLFTKLGILKTKTKYPSITVKKSLFKTFLAIKVCFDLCTPFIWWRICSKRNKIMFVLWGHYIVFSSCGCLAPFSFELWSECITHINFYFWCSAKYALTPEKEKKKT